MRAAKRLKTIDLRRLAEPSYAHSNEIDTLSQKKLRGAAMPAPELGWQLAATDCTLAAPGRSICTFKASRYSAVMTLKTLAYTSLAQLDLSASDLEDIHRSARQFNAFNGITGLLIFNGTHFLQVIEGGEETIDGLVDNLRRDSRHTGFEIRDQSLVEERSFPNWSMELVHIQSGYFEAREDIVGRLPPTISPEVRDRVLDMTRSISRTLTL